MTGQNKIAGLVLAGGLGRRMAHQDKGLLLLNGQPLISHAVYALRPVVDELVISANRHPEYYARWASRVISDDYPGYSGPLAGILTAMRQLDAEILLVMPCDSPRFGSAQLQRLLQGLQDDIDVVVAGEGERLHPVFMAVRSRMQANLTAYLDSGQRRLQDWVRQQAWIAVDFQDQAGALFNINTPADLACLEASHS